MANIYDKVEELKRLQKEIDRCDEVMSSLVISNWGKTNGYSKEGFDKNLKHYQIKSDCQLKIKQIIEEL